MKHTPPNPLRSVPIRTLLRAFYRSSRLTRHPSTWAPRSPEEMMLANLRMAAELNRRCPRPLATRLAVYGLYA